MDQNLTDIKNVIFDLGGVMIDLDRDEAVRRLESIGVANAGDLLGLYRQDGIFLALETGKSTAADFYDAIREKTPGQTGDREIQEAFNGFLIALPMERLKKLKELREAGYTLYALSNTNPVMFHSWIAREFSKLGGNFRDYFDGIVVSFEEGICKPDRRIFSTILKRYGLLPEETLMLDDSADNCHAAGSIGIRYVKIDNAGDNSMMNVCDTLIATKGNRI